MADISLKKAALYNAGAKYGTMVIQIGLTMILSRLVLPEAYGVVVILTVMTNFLALFADMGLGAAVIQHPEFKKTDINELFTFCTLVGLFLAFIMIISGYPISIVYNNPSYIYLCPIVSVNALLVAMNTIPNALLMRDKRFDVIAIRSITCTFISGIIAVTLAFYGAGVYALLALHISSNLAIFFWNYRQYPLRFSKFVFSRVASLLGRYSLFQFLFNILNYFTRNLDNLIIGAKFNKAALGYYDKAYTLSLYPNNIFTAVITGVMHPYIRDYRNDYRALYNRLVGVLKLLSVCGSFVMLICNICSKELILIMFGYNWEESIPCFQMLSLCMWAQFISPVAGSVFLGIERTDQTFKCGIINFILILCAIGFGIYMDSVAYLALGISIAYILIFLITFYIMLELSMNIGFWGVIRTILPEAVFSYGIIILSLFIYPTVENIYISLIIKVALIVMLMAIYLITTKQLSVITTLIKRFNGK